MLILRNDFRFMIEDSSACGRFGNLEKMRINLTFCQISKRKS